MNILYKYCDQLGIVKILESLELKLPYVSQVNDPLECLPVLYCPDDKSAMKEQWLRSFNRNHISPPVHWEQKLDEAFKKGDYQKRLEKETRKDLKDFNRKSCLLSVSKTAQNTVMWAHYADKHEGTVIGIDFNNVYLYPDTNGPSNLVMEPVSYSKDRPKINIYSEVRFEELRKAFLTKSIDWKYEKEFRTILSVSVLEISQQQGLALLKDFKGKKDFESKKTWFLRLNPESIREIILGLYTEEGLKLAIRKLIERAELQHVKLYQAEESETYTLNLVGQ